MVAGSPGFERAGGYHHSSVPRASQAIMGRLSAVRATKGKLTRSNRPRDSRRRYQSRAIAKPVARKNRACNCTMSFTSPSVTSSLQGVIHGRLQERFRAEGGTGITDVSDYKNTIAR